jgi:hypothetical protein
MLDVTARIRLSIDQPECRALRELVLSRYGTKSRTSVGLASQRQPQKSELCRTDKELCALLRGVQ